MDRSGREPKAELADIVRQRQLRALFQPIVGAAEGRLFAHEALLRGPADSPLCAPLELFAASRQAGTTTELDLLALQVTVEHFAAGAFRCKPFVNLLPQTLISFAGFPEWLRELLQRNRLATDQLVIEILRAMLDMAHVLGSRVIAEGIENERQLELLRSIGVDYLQGFHVSRPLDDATVDTGSFGIAPMRGGPPSGGSCVGDLCMIRQSLAPESRISEALSLFQTHPDWESLAVVADGRPLGVIRRDVLLLTLSKPLHPEIFHPKPVTRLMDRRMLVIDERTRLSQASRLITRNRQSRINEDFIIARDGRYCGLGRSIELLHHITEQQLHDAQQSNPLTLLPGNREIDSEVFRLLALRAPFAICHADIDYFKPFNDQYGYSRGDQVLLHLAGLCRSAGAEGLDFVGHPGGDDFILIMRSLDWQRRIALVVESFSASCARFYSDEHRAAGGFLGLDRDGSERMFPMMSLSVGAANVDPTRQGSTADLMRVLSTAKQRAKTRSGNAIIMSDGEQEQTMVLTALVS